MKKVNGASLVVGLLLACIAIMGSAFAAPLPKGNCANPKPYTDLRHCNFEGKNLSNKDLRGTDLRDINFHNARLQGTDLTAALISGDGIIGAALDNVKGLPQEGLSFYKKYFLVTPKSNQNSSVTLSPHEPVYGIQTDIAGQANILMVKKTEDKLHTLAVLDWPRDAEGGKMTIVARFDNDKSDVPACNRSVDLLKDSRYYWPHWELLKIKPLENGGYLIGVQATGSDSDGEGVSGWEMVALLKLSASCNLSILHKEDTSWAEGVDNTECQGDHLEYGFLDEQTAEIKMTAHTCDASAKSRAKVTHKKIKLN